MVGGRPVVGGGAESVGEDEKGAGSICWIVVRIAGKVILGAWACCADILILWDY